jgi:hypothetical protein
MKKKIESASLEVLSPLVGLPIELLGQLRQHGQVDVKQLLQTGPLL